MEHPETKLLLPRKEKKYEGDVNGSHLRLFKKGMPVWLLIGAAVILNFIFARPGENRQVRIIQFLRVCGPFI